MTVKNAKAFFLKILQADWFWFLVLFVGVIGLYVQTMPRTNTGYGDSDLFLLLSQKLGLPLPPGYPLYLWLLAGFTRLPWPWSLPISGHLLNIIFSALTVAFVYLIASIFVKSSLSLTLKIKIHSNFIRVITALTVALSLAFCLYFWLFGQMAGKFPLIGLLTASLLLCFTLFAVKKTGRSRKLFFLLGYFLLGLSMSYAYHLWLLLPALIYLQFSYRPKFNFRLWLFAGGLFLLAFLLPLLSLPYLNSRDATISYDLGSGLVGWSSYLTKSELFQNQFLSSTTAFVFKPINLNQVFPTLTVYFKMIAQAFSPLILLILAFSLILGFRYKLPLFFFYLLSFVLIGPAIAAYLGWSQDWLPQTEILPQLLPGFITLACVTAFGWYEAYRRFDLSLQRLYKPQVGLIILTGFVLVFGFITGFLHFSKVDLFYLNSASRRYQQVLAEVPEKTILVCFSQSSCYTLLYQQQVEGTRPDVTIIPLTYQLIRKKLIENRLLTFNYPENSFVFMDLIASNLGKRPVAAVDINDYYYNFLGFNTPFVYYIPHGSWGELTRAVPKKLPEYSLDFGQDPDPQAGSLADPMRLYLKTQPARDMFLNAGILIKMDQRLRALKELNQAANIFFKLDEKDQSQIESIRQNIEQTSVDPDFSPGAKVLTAAQLLTYIPSLLNNNQLSRAYQAAFGSVFVEPENVSARLAFANVLEKMGKFEESLQEYHNVLQIDPQNASASAAVIRLTP